MLGEATCHAYSKSQAVIALSSGEAEYYGFASAASASLGVQSALKDLGWHFGIQILMDASAGIAIGSRRGLGKTKHIDTVFLWAQELVTSKKVKLTKRKTDEMLADFLTKNVEASKMMKCMSGLNLQFMTGQSKLALQA